LATVSWSQTAAEDIDEISRFISRDSSVAASDLVDRFLQAAQQLETFPLSGRRLTIPRRREHFRELVVRDYRLIYTVSDENSRIEILRVRHGARRIDLDRLP
jgi:toxin ParE1/3/4